MARDPDYDGVRIETGLALRLFDGLMDGRDCPLDIYYDSLSESFGLAFAEPEHPDGVVRPRLSDKRADLAGSNVETYYRRFLRHVRPITCLSASISNAQRHGGIMLLIPWLSPP